MVVYEETNRRIYSKDSPWINAIDDNWMSKSDLEHVKLNPMKTAEHVSTYRPLQNRVMINFTEESCGWGGK